MTHHRSGFTLLNPRFEFGNIAFGVGNADKSEVVFVRKAAHHKVHLLNGYGRWVKALGDEDEGFAFEQVVVFIIEAVDKDF